ncbi:DUF3954 domain-containing protein [Bacillus cereus group sp. BfR-BA-01380]|uniref:DUF3954 domain-containing protein n=1 Tax=Bacillus cereus group sp. BfR-BA-01380 TaxID=2920324 RepID=UPI001F57CE40|nr:DUF3954 domain-containing protein [Bacillus cereus group sp. BfR-BA-01380]
MSKEIFTKSKQLTAEIDITKDRIFVVKGGQVTPYEKPQTGFGEQVVIWQNGKAVRVETKYTEKIE